MSKEQKRQAFYTQSPEEVLNAVDATEQGLSSSEAEKRLAEFGHNELEEGEKRSILVKFIEQFKDCLLYTSPSPRDQRGSRMPSSA